jgi:hypothetical protein
VDLVRHRDIKDVRANDALSFDGVGHAPEEIRKIGGPVVQRVAQREVST